MHPTSEAAGIVLHAIQHSACAMDEHAAQIFVATLADPQQSGFAAGRALLGNQAEPGGKVTSLAEGSAVADGRNRCGGSQRPYAGDLPQTLAACIGAGNPFDLIVGLCNVSL